MVSSRRTALVTDASGPGNGKKSRLVPLLVLMIVVLLGGLLYQGSDKYLAGVGGVTIDLINDTPGPMLDVLFEYPGGKFTLPSLGPQGEVGHSIPSLADFDATLSFKNEQGQQYKETVRVRPYNGMLALLTVQAILETSVVKTAEGKEETMLKASAKKIFNVRSYQRPGGSSGK
jgi:hypothetical protein